MKMHMINVQNFKWLVLLSDNIFLYAEVIHHATWIDGLGHELGRRSGTTTNPR